MDQSSLPPCLVLMAGLPGTGKSTLARALATRLGGLVLDKDRIRAALFSEPWIEYSQRQDDFCIEILLQAAAYLLGRPHVPPFIFLDGRPFALRSQVERVVTWAAETGYRLKLIRTVCSDEAAHQRLMADSHTELRSNDDKLYCGCSEMFLIQEKPAKEATLGRSFSSAAKPFCT